jgi:hypothetical protein
MNPLSIRLPEWLLRIRHRTFGLGYLGGVGIDDLIASRAARSEAISSCSARCIAVDEAGCTRPSVSTHRIVRNPIDFLYQFPHESLLTRRPGAGGRRGDSEVGKFTGSPRSLGSGSLSFAHRRIWKSSRSRPTGWCGQKWNQCLRAPDDMRVRKVKSHCDTNTSRLNMQLRWLPTTALHGATNAGKRPLTFRCPTGDREMVPNQIAGRRRGMAPLPQTNQACQHDLQHKTYNSHGP